MNKQEIYDLLNRSGVTFEAVEHKAVCNMAQLSEIEMPWPEAEAKNLFVRDDKKQRYILITVKGEKRVDLKAFRHAHQMRPLSFATAEELMDKLGLIPGAVTPLGALNDQEGAVQVFIDRELSEEQGLVAVHPNDNTATLRVPLSDLLALFEDRAVPYRFVATSEASAQ